VAPILGEIRFGIGRMPPGQRRKVYRLWPHSQETIATLMGIINGVYQTVPAKNPKNPSQASMVSLAGS
jgi:hypothetical protein